MTSQDKKYSLFLDSSQGLRVGLLSESLEWVSFDHYDVKKSSSLLFLETEKLLSENEVELSGLKSVFLMMGPGSYTGIRLLQGMKDLYSEMGIEVFGFYSFEIPFLSNEEPAGIFVTSAYKGEFYRYEWREDHNEQEIMNSVSSATASSYEKTYGVSESIGDIKLISVYSVLERCSEKIFSNIVKRQLKRDAFYFRPLEKEFKVSFPEVN